MTPHHVLVKLAQEYAEACQACDKAAPARPIDLELRDIAQERLLAFARLAFRKEAPDVTR